MEKTLKANNGDIQCLNPKSRVPHNKRKREVKQETINFIIKSRKKYPYGKEKISKMLEDEGIDNISIPKAGRIIADLKKRGLISKGRKCTINGKTGNLKEKEVKKKQKNRVGDYKPQNPGDLIQIDTIVLFIFGIKRYIITAIDLKSDFGFALAYKNRSSESAKDFFKKLQLVAPFEIKKVQTDNGGEFEKNFGEYLEKSDIDHFFIYPRCPKMNAYVERFNRTLKEEFVNTNRILLSEDIVQFNLSLMNYLIFYNTKRPHHSLNLLSPMKYILNELRLSDEKSNMWWANTYI